MLKKSLNNGHKLFFVLLFIILFTQSCASQEERVELIRQEVEVINNKVDNKNIIKGLAFKEEKRLQYRGHFIDDKLVYIFCDANLGVLSSATYMIYYKNGEPIYINIIEIGFSAGQQKRKRDVKAEIFFDGENVLESSKMISGNYTEFTDEEVKELLDISKLVYDAAIEKKEASKSLSLDWIRMIF